MTRPLQLNCNCLIMRPQPRAACLLLLMCGFLLPLVTVAAIPIHDAVMEDSPEYLRQAIEAGDDLNQIGPGGQTPLMHAVLAGKEAAVRFLLQAGADTSIGEKDGYTPLHGAGFQGRAEIARMLIAHGLDPAERHSDG